MRGPQPTELSRRPSPYGYHALVLRFALVVEPPHLLQRALDPRANDTLRKVRERRCAFHRFKGGDEILGWRRSATLDETPQHELHCGVWLVERYASGGLENEEKGPLPRFQARNDPALLVVRASRARFRVMRTSTRDADANFS